MSSQDTTENLNSVKPVAAILKKKKPLIRRIEGLRFLIPNRLAFICRTAQQILDLKAQFLGQKIHFITFEQHRQYIPFVADFGPVNLAVVHRFYAKLSKLLSTEEGLQVYWMDPSFESRANASFLLGCFMLLQYKWSPQQAAHPFICYNAPFHVRPFRDAGLSPNTFELTLLDCFSGLDKAVKLGWYVPLEFDVEMYENLEHPSNGDAHVMCPKFVAFKGPLAQDSPHRRSKEIAIAPEHLVPVLRRLGASCVIRLNDPETYEPAVFLKAGFRHEDLNSYDDYIPPSDDDVETFLDICDRERRLAVHCRAGLGRTGTLIGLWMMKHAGFTANEAIAWLRIVRPGCVVGSQQHYLKACERRPWAGNRLGPAPAESEDIGERHLAPPPSQFIASGTSESPASAAAASPSDMLPSQRVTARLCMRGAIKASFSTPTTFMTSFRDVSGVAAAAAAAAAAGSPSFHGGGSQLQLPRVFRPSNRDRSAESAAAGPGSPVSGAAGVDYREGSRPGRVSPDGAGGAGGPTRLPRLSVSPASPSLRRITPGGAAPPSPVFAMSRSNLKLAATVPVS